MRGLRRGDTAPSYRQAFKKRRCLIPVDGFYEWKKVLGENIPYSVSIKDVVFTDASQVKEPYEVVGIISYDNPGKYQVLSLGDAIEPLKTKAREIGANGIIIDKSQPIKSGFISTGILPKLEQYGSRTEIDQRAKRFRNHRRPQVKACTTSGKTFSQRLSEKVG